MLQDIVNEINVHNKVFLHAYLQFRLFLHFLDCLANMFVCMIDNVLVVMFLHTWIIKFDQNNNDINIL